MKLPTFIAKRWDAIRGNKTITDPWPILRSQIDFAEMFRSQYDRPRWYDECYGAYEAVAAVYMLVNIPASALAQVPLRVYQKGRGGGRLLKAHERKALSKRIGSKAAMAIASDEVEEITDDNHPYVSLLRQWSMRDDAFSGLHKLITHIRIAGGAYIAPIQGGNTIDRLEVIDPRHVRPNIAEQGDELVESFSGVRDGRTQWTHDSADIVPIGFEHPNHPGRWHGWLHSSMDEAGMLYDMVKSRRALFQNGGRPGPTIKGAKTQAQIDSIQSQWSQRFADARKAHVPLVLLDGMDAVIDKSAIDLDFVNGYQQVMETLAAAAGVPMTLLQQQDANLAGAVNAAPVFAEMTLAPIARLIEDKFNERISPYFGDGVFVAFDDLIGQDEERQARIAQLLVGGPTMTPNEYRAERGQPPVEGGDVLLGAVQPAEDPLAALFARQGQASLSDGDVLRVAKAVADMLPRSPDPVVQIIDRGASQDDVSNGQKSTETTSNGENRITGDTKTITYEDAVYLAEPMPGCNCDCSSPPRGRKDIDDKDGYEAAARKLTQETAEWYERTYIDAVELVRDTPSLSQAAALAFIQSAADDLFDVQADTLQSMFSAGYEMAGRELPAEAVDVTVQQENMDDAFAAYRQNRVRLAQGIGETLLDDADRRVQRIVQDGLERGLRQDEIADALETEFIEKEVPKLSRQRAETIARTEVAHALGEGRLALFRQSDIVKGKQYLLSSNPCPICEGVARKNLGKVIPLDEPFLKAGESVGSYSPGRDIVTTPTHPRCRCDWAPVLEEFSE